MKKAEIIRNAIKEAEKHGYNWEFKNNRLTWNYLTPSKEYFEFSIKDEAVRVRYISTYGSELFALKTFGDSKYDDAETVEQAVKQATLSTIRRANCIF